MIVADVNVIAQLVISTEYRREAESVFELDHEWAAPELWLSEFRNLLATHVRLKYFSLNTALGYLAFARSLIEKRTHGVDSGEVLTLAAASGCTAYDCEYLALARALEVRLVTFDKQLLKHFPSTAISPADFVALRAGG